MGELVTKDKTGDWLTRIDASRQNLISAANSGSKMKAAFATADARAELIETLKDEEIRAKLLRISGADIGMVELANNPTDDDRVKWCAIAILSGFCPGEDQFAIFGGGKDRDGNAKPGKLYTKEAGFRTLFAHLGIVPEVAIGHPEFVPLGTTGKKVWRVGGKASCEYQGTSYSVEFTGPAALGLPGYESDNVAGISAKARRQMLKALWAKVSPILTQDHSEPDDDTIPQDAPAAIGVTEPQKLADEKPVEDMRKIERKVFDDTKKAIQRRVKDEAQLGSIMAYWQEIEKATNKDALRLLYKDIETTQVKPLGKNNVDELLRWCKWCADGIVETEGGAA